MRVRLTDQALVAVRLGVAVADDAGREATVGHLIAGLAAEPDGRAGRRLRERATAAAMLTERCRTAAGPPLEAALRSAAVVAVDRAADTVDLLDAAVSSGPEVTALLDACGYARDLDGYAAPGPFVNWSDEAETYGWDPAGAGPFTSAAARVLAQARARTGRASDVLLAIAAAPDADGTVLLDDADTLASRLERLERRRTGDGAVDDAGLETLTAAAVGIAAGTRVTTADLVRAALVAGGATPRALLTAPDRDRR